MRGETRGDLVLRQEVEFQSTPLMRGETVRTDAPATRRGISIHSPHARGDGLSAAELVDALISIHSPHARGDIHDFSLFGEICISIHSPHARGDFVNILDGVGQLVFQSTPLMRGETKPE